MIVVTGMHRSGTSLFAQLLLRLGLDFGNPSGFSADRSRLEAGYTEHDDVIDLNSLLITGFPRHQGALAAALSQAVYTRMPGPAAIARRAATRAAELREAAARYQGLAVKDVRFCLTLDAWRPFVPIDRVVVCLRHPGEVVRSLRSRQRYPLWLGYRFWNYHVRSLLRQIEGLPVLYVRFEALTGAGHGAELARIAAFLPLKVSNPALQDTFETLFDPALRHHRADAEAPLPPITRALWDDLVARHRTQADAPVPDRAPAPR
jgi:hypothetical protein